MFSLCVPIDDQAERPNLIECIRFRGRERRINIPQEISIKYYQFGVLLLEDDTGARTCSIANKHRDDAEQINMEVLQQWVNGRGKRPITWKTLTEVLHDIELNTLAREIEVVKCHEDKASGGLPVGISESDGPVQGDQMTISTVEGSEQRSTRDISTAGMEDKHCETLQQRVDVAADLLSDSKDSKKIEKNQLFSNSEAEKIAINSEDSEENQENQITSVPHRTGNANTRPLQNEALD